MAQDYQLLAEEEKWKIRLHSYVLVHIDNLALSDLSTLQEIKSPLALYISKYNTKYEPLLQRLGSVVDSVLVLSDVGIRPDLFQNNWSAQVGMSDVDVLEVNESGKWGDVSALNIGNELLRIRATSVELLTDSILIDIWKRSGKVPNFIELPSKQILKADSITQRLTRYHRIYGTVKSREGLLYGVNFDNHKDLLVNGHFSYPETIDEPLPILVPHKAGYYFSPDIIRTTLENRGNLKEFIGFPLDFEYGLTDHFVFGPSISNIVRKNHKELIVKNVLVKDDAVHGKVGYFDKGTFVGAGLNSRTALQGDFTITAWVKPTVLSMNNSILGKGENFVLKLHNGYLTFTMADVKDYISEASPVPVDQWTHTALVHSELAGELTFYINGMQTDKIKLIENYDTSDHNMMVGSNLWEEFFIGYLTDIKIWDRELNPIEIAKDFQIPAVIESKWSIRALYVGLAAFFAFLLLFLSWRFWLKKRSAGSTSLEPNPVPSPHIPSVPDPVLEHGEPELPYTEKLFCFGPLRIINSEGEDVAKRLSPKLKQLFLIVLLHSVQGRKGISTKKLTELIWPGSSSKNAKNTRGTSIQNLRAVLSHTQNIRMEFLEKHWYLDIGENCYCDYQEVLYGLDQLDKEGRPTAQLEKRLPALLRILKEGRFLANTADAWLDPYVERLSDRLIEWCLQIAKTRFLEKDASELYDLAMIIYIYDDLNEDALQIKLNVLVKQGKLSLAHTVYDNFSKLYKKLYGEAYAIKFEDFVGNTNL